MSPTAADAYRLAEASSVQRPYIGLAVALVRAGDRHRDVQAPQDRGRHADRREAGGAGDAQERLELPPPGARRGGDLPLRRRRRSRSAASSSTTSKSPYIGGLTESAGARLVSFYWGGAMVGRFIGTLTLRMCKPAKVLTIHALAAGRAGPGHDGDATARWRCGPIIAVGLFNSIMFPTIFTLAIDGLGQAHRARARASSAWPSWAARSSRCCRARWPTRSGSTTASCVARPLLRLHRLVRPLLPLARQVDGAHLALESHRRPSRLPAWYTRRL